MLGMSRHPLIKGGRIAGNRRKSGLLGGKRSAREPE
jgi:hypothetical protein